MKYFKTLALLSVFSVSQIYAVAQSTVNVTFRYSANDNAVRAFVPGEFNNWGNNTNGQISTTNASLMIEDTTNGFWYKSISLNIGGGTSTYEGASGYAYKFHEQYNASGSEWQWFTDPLNPIAIGQNNDSFVEVSNPMIFQLQASSSDVVGEEDEIWATVAATDVDSIDIDASEIFVNGVSAGSFGAGYDKERQLLAIKDLSALPLEVGENTIRVNAITESGASKADSITFAYLPDVEPELAARPAGLQDGITYGEDPTTVSVSLFAPNKDYVFAIGDFNDWKVDADYLLKKDSLNADSVWYWLEIDGLTPGKEYGFQYLIDGELRITDPYSSLVLDPFNDGFISSSTFPNLLAYPEGKTNGLVTVLEPGKSDYNWEATDYQRPEKTELVIYELLIRDFLDTKNFQTLTDTLDYFEKLGVNAIELMPVNEFDGNLSWGYNPSHHLALDKFYGSPDAFKKFVDEAHKRGIAVIIDVVMNHATGDNPLYRLYSENNPYFNATPRHNFNVFNDFNHQYAGTQYYTRRMIEHWIEEYNIDGFRWDLTKGFTQNCPNDNTGCTSNYQQDRVDVLRKYADHQWAADEDFIIIFEHLGSEQEERQWTNYRISEGKGIMTWGNMNFAYSEASMGYHDSGKSNLYGVLSESRSSFQRRHLVGYMESHDEQWLMLKNRKFGNSFGDYDITELGTALGRQKLAGAFFFPLPGPKMMWQFGELGYGGGEDECLKPGGSGEAGDCLESDPNRVGEKPVRWEYYEDNERLKVYKTWSALINLRRSSPVFTNPDATNYKLAGVTKWYALEHEDSDALVVGNFGVTETTTMVTYPSEGTWYDFFTGSSETISGTQQEITLAPGEFKVYTTKEFETPEDDLLTSKEEESLSDVPSSFSLGRNYPNPFNPTTTFSYDLAETSIVKLEVFDMLGRRVAELENGRKSAGSYSVRFDAGNLSSGIYIYRLQAAGKVFTQKMTLIK
jgi:glycosidase